MRPLVLVEGEGFKRFMSIVQLAYEVLHVVGVIKDIYGDEKVKVAHELGDITLITDIWTSTSVDSCFGFTSHYISSSWELKT